MMSVKGTNSLPWITDGKKANVNKVSATTIDDVVLLNRQLLNDIAVGVVDTAPVYCRSYLKTIAFLLLLLL